MPEMEIITVEVVWDTEQEDGSTPDAQSIGLPRYATLMVESNLSPDDLDTVITDHLSNTYGYCVLNYN